MASLTVFPVGNGDSMLIEFDDERLMLVDYCSRKVAEDEADKRIDLKNALRSILAKKKRNEIDIVAFTHCHEDHCAGVDEFFYFEHADKYKDDERIHMKELWLPAAMVVTEGLSGCMRVIRQEARHRLKSGSGIRVFSELDQLEDWTKEQADLTFDDIKSLVTHAGNLAPGFSVDDGNVEVFIHAPFKADFEPDGHDHNGSSLVLHFNFFPMGSSTKILLGADAEFEVWQKIVTLSEKNQNSERLDWDVFKIAHHCSYSALSDEEGEKITEPVEEIKRLFDRGEAGRIIIASCNVIDSESTPPHLQTAAYYKLVADDLGGEFLVTMEYPKKEAPEPIVIDIRQDGPSLSRSASKHWIGVSSAVTKPSPRYGK